ncbi:uncharacterized protein N7473_007508 [Penicillium subrubescens]|uniref:Uncharacterized protein n=1 Tax=Penicillium subrubescens TaxID=1316194 RepID=A0A1Q5SSI6_9EURO|nr:uncharacterized protein N7473_007508 [Penicillium subrubescens]KAJ5891280.1 hypothetical protein N7473_007508 [Penicillium subrubescens]OKO90886.1 hypothetical protein PENSUB_13187 [Penicillium subrubescens]
MPGVGVMSASEDTPERPLLRSHKALPRRGIVVPQIELAQPASPESNGTVIAAPAPPLTPPSANQEDSMGEEQTPRKINSSRSEDQSTGILTPRRPSKPPTPDVTPPRTTSIKRPTLSHTVHLSSSSRADSFQTARESISSDGDMETPVRSRSQSASQKAKKRVPSTSRKNAPNGVREKLTYSKYTPPSASQPLSETEYETGFESFDGEWASIQTDVSPTPLVEKRKPSKSRSVSNHKPKADKDTLDVLHLDESLMREKNLRDRVQKTHQVAESPSMERFREDIGWPSHHDGPSNTEEAESRRLSGVSSTSTVEAMIIDSPKRAPRSLRHTEKRTSLRSASSPITRSERASTASNADSQHRLVHKAARISEQDRRSISSDISFSTKTTTSVSHTPGDIIPVVVIPERRSSLKSGPNSHISSKPGSQRSSQRPPPVSSDGSVNVPRQRQRTMSDSVSAKSRDKDSRGRLVGRPVIPPRSSSLSAPTSRNNSRATSLTSESLRSHTLAMDLEMQKRRDQQPVSPPRHNILGPNGYGKKLLEPPNLPEILVSSTDDMATLRPPSLPYTQWSIPSSSPGPIEIREATAVSLFAHNNRSLLLVDQRVPPDQRVFAALAQGFSAREPIPQTPDNPIQAGEIFVESPLKNPRPPPKPPVSKPLPPIPTEEDATKEGPGGLVRRWSSVRRTLSTRSRSDSFNTITRSLSMRSAKNRKAGIEMDSRLHPFWRPRGFWEDVPGSPPKARSAVQTPAELGFVSNSLGLPQQRLIFEGPPAMNRRNPEMKRFFNGLSSSARYNTSHGSLVEPGGILRTGSPLYQDRYRTLSRWGMRWRSLSLRNVRARIRRVRQRREERKRAARRETLKQSIGGPVYVVSSATNGVVR